VLPIDQIIAGDRTIGLLNPITVDENGRLLAGARRLAACKRRERPLRGRR
jgi:ParB-like chromosome segregation protein Spo0J